MEKCLEILEFLVDLFGMFSFIALPPSHPFQSSEQCCPPASSPCYLQTALQFAGLIIWRWMNISLPVPRGYFTATPWVSGRDYFSGTPLSSSSSGDKTRTLLSCKFPLPALIGASSTVRLRRLFYSLRRFLHLMYFLCLVNGEMP